MNYKSDILFLVKKRLDSYGVSIGLINSMNFTCAGLAERAPFTTNCERCVDANEIDKFIVKHKPKFCVIEAIWVTPSKLAELERLHPSVTWIIRVHSKVPFIANEGNAVAWLKEYSNLENVYVSFNHIDTSNDFKGVTQTSDYLPNIYLQPEYVKDKEPRNKDKKLNIGCFGAQRIQKNGLIQAFAAMDFADKHDLILNYHINANRIEQNSEGVLKNIRALFANTKHQLHEIPWLSHKNFLDLVSKMDVTMQVSHSESFNIVTADSIYCGVPAVVSSEIDWMPPEAQANPNKMQDIVQKLGWVIDDSNNFVRASRARLDAYNNRAVEVWIDFLSSF